MAPRESQLHLRVSLEELEMLRVLAERRGITSSALVRMWIRGAWETLQVSRVGLQVLATITALEKAEPPTAVELARTLAYPGGASALADVLADLVERGLVVAKRGRYRATERAREER